jgi:hypothetical protein
MESLDFELPFLGPNWGTKNGGDQLMNASMQPSVYRKVYATFKAFVGLDPRRPVVFPTKDQGFMIFLAIITIL